MDSFVASGADLIAGLFGRGERSCGEEDLCAAVGEADGQGASEVASGCGDDDFVLVESHGGGSCSWSSAA